jgi:hypothetical protein
MEVSIRDAPDVSGESAWRLVRGRRGFTLR